MLMEYEWKPAQLYNERVRNIQKTRILPPSPVQEQIWRQMRIGLMAAHKHQA
jgi:hypothetical protein